jgi:cyclic-di-GMP phosphodiesterase, flagellum assembly factor TipF
MTVSNPPHAPADGRNRNQAGPQPADLAGNLPGNQASASIEVAAGIPDNGRKSETSVFIGRIVVPCMLALAAALAALAYVQFEWTAGEALVSGITVLAGSLAVHAQVQKSAEITRLKSEIARIEQGRASAPVVANAGKQGVETAPHNKPGAYAQQLSNPASLTPTGVLQNSPLEPHPRWEQTLASEAPHAANGTRAAAAGHGGRNRPTSSTASAGSRSEVVANAHAVPVDAALWPGTSLVTPDTMRDQWAFRPRDAAATLAPNIATTPAPMDKAVVAFQVAHRSHTTPTPSSIDSDLAIVQRKIKALADEVNAADALKSVGVANAPARSAASVLDQSIEALKVTAGAMREPSVNMPVSQTSRPLLLGDLPIPASAERIAVSRPIVATRDPAPAAAEAVASSTSAAPMASSVPERAPAAFESDPPRQPARIAAIASAIEAGRIEVRLSPIVGLSTHEVSHYDLSFRLSSVTGDVFDRPERDLMFASHDLLALFDTARLLRASALAARLEARRKGGSLLSPVAGPSMTNAQFLETFARVFEEREGVSSQLVLTFAQADTEQFSPSAWQALSDMHAFGFRFALDAVDHLSTDFALLARRGFTFVKLSTDALLNGMPSQNRFIPASEICRHIAGSGLTLVAGQIDDDAVRARVFGFGVLFGQGQLFGGARQVSVDVPVPGGQPAAA